MRFFHKVEISAEIHTEILEGLAVDAILRVDEMRGSDLIVMGAPGPVLIAR